MDNFFYPNDLFKYISLNKTYVPAEDVKVKILTEGLHNVHKR